MAKRGAIICGAIAVLVVIAAVILIVYFTLPEDEESVCPSSTIDANRFDCYPEDGADQTKCEERGCCWREPEDDANAPWCFYPTIYGYEVIREPSPIPLGITLNLQWLDDIPRRYPYGVSNTVEKLQVDIEHQTDSRLRIKIYDETTDRFEVPLQLPKVTEKAKNPLYDVKYTDYPFSLQITRIDTGTVIFDTSVGGFTYTNQFIQMSTKFPSSNVYGFGEHNHRQYRHNLDWKTWAIFTRDVAPVDEWNLYGAQPLHMCIEDDGNAHGILFLNSNAMDIVLQPAPALTYRTIGGILDFYIFLGPSPEDIVKQYTLEFTGTPMMPPYWALGFQLCKWGYEDLDQVKNIVEDMRDHNIPQDVQYADIDYMSGYRDFTIDQEKWAGLGEFFDELHAYGQRGIIILDHGIHNEDDVQYAPYESGNVMNIWINESDAVTPIEGEVWPGYSYYPDFTNPECAKWWTNHSVQFYNEVPYDALWIDMNEPSNFVQGSTSDPPCNDNSLNFPPYLPKILGGLMYDKTICMDSVQHLGIQYDLHSLYGHSMSVVTHETLKTIFPDKRSMVLTRSQFAGTGHFAGHWLGDNQSQWRQIPWSVVGMLEYALFGFPYIGADICGFWYNTTESMCQRWQQLGAFYPYSRNHNADGWAHQHPTVWSDDVIDNIRFYLMERYRLLPFLYTLFYGAYTKGSTVVRPFAHEFPTDEKSRDVDTQFLWGPCFMITPVMTEDAVEVDAYFPDDRWYDYYTGEEIAEEIRGTTVTLDAPMDYMPLHVRGGYVIPTQEPNTTTTTSRQNSFGLIVGLGSGNNSESVGNMFWDDGESRETIENGDYTLISFEATENDVKIRVQKADYITGLTELAWDTLRVFGLQEQPAEVLADGEPVYFEYDSGLKVLSVTEMGMVDITIDHNITWIAFTSFLHPAYIFIFLNVCLSRDEGFRNHTEDVHVTPVDTDRFDCYPEPNANQIKCESRGCIWAQPQSDENAPWCYYPSVYGYEITGEPLETTLGKTMEVLWIDDIPKRYSDDVSTTIEKLRVDIEHQTDTRLRIKIYDENANRYEVPLQLPEVTTKAESPLYAVEYIDSPFSLQIQRIDTGTIIFDTSVGGFTYTNQFIQMSTKFPSSNVYGFGEHNHRQYRHNLDWKTWAIFTRDIEPVVKWNLYGAHALHMCIEDDGNAHGVLLLNSNAMDIVLQPTPALTYRTIGGILDFYVFLGPSPEDIVNQYTVQVIGPPMMPPYWALGFQLCKWGYESLDEVKGIVEDMRAQGIPQDVQYADVDHMSNYRDFTVDPVNWAGLGEFFEELHEYGQHGIIILDHAIHSKEGNGYLPFDTGEEMHVWINETDGITPLEGEMWPGLTYFPDFTNPVTQIWWTAHCVDFHEEVPYDALWIDMDEPSNFVQGSTSDPPCNNNSLNFPPYLPKIRGSLMYDDSICMDSVQYLGTHYDVHSLYGHSMSVMTHEALKTVFPNKRSMTLTRSQFTGTGHVAGHWSGDNQSQWRQIPWSIIAMLEYSLFGFPYMGSDICGFWYNTTESMCQRWHQLGAFYPYSRNHNADGWTHQHPTVWSDDVIDNIRYILLERYKLLPFLYTLFFRAYTEGSTVVRPFAHEFPTDKQSLVVETQFLWGPCFMVTPVMKEGEEIPEANRGTTVTLDAPMDYIPLHVRGGYVIPTQEPNTTTTLSRQNSFGMIVALGSGQLNEATGSLFWDDGDSRETIENGTYTLISFSATNGNVDITVEKTGYTMYLTDLSWNTLRVFGLQDKPTEVFADGVSVAFEYNSELKVMEVNELGMKDVTANHQVTWS
uniref:Maltase-glucoamylase, intestinal-like n=1 Tax=Saccoglossus kowalevskii TaxID=10224 RepID=A0ABM0N1B8_SACKO|nr:PREDICTED: maltase-glucoamylase, intestinal-like [Saccoglossus kowalevskii]